MQLKKRGVKKYVKRRLYNYVEGLVKALEVDKESEKRLEINQRARKGTRVGSKCLEGC